MNPIENVWGDMVKDLDGKAAASKEEMFEKVNRISDGYKNRSPTYCETLVEEYIENKVRGHY